MHAYEEFHERIMTCYLSLSEERDGGPVYAIEHGLDPSEIPELRKAVSRRLERFDHTGTQIAWPVLAFAAEIGYSYEGLLSGYWPKLESAVGLPLGTREREALSEHYVRGQKIVGLAAPDDTPFSRSFRHIAWPIANALAPRQIHAGLCDALLQAVTLDRDDTELYRAVQQGCRRSGLQALIAWASNEARIDAVATALLEAPDKRLSRRIVTRLQHDMMSASSVRDTLVRARVERARGQRSRMTPRSNDPARQGDLQTGEENDRVELPFTLSGGVRLALQSYACGLPVRLDALKDLRVTGADDEKTGPRTLVAGQSLTLASLDPKQITLGYRDASDARRSTSLRFEHNEPLPALVDVQTEPSGAVLDDLRKDQLTLYSSLSSPPGDLRATRWPQAIQNLDVRLELRMAGTEMLCARDRFQIVPGRLRAGGSGLSVLRDALHRRETKAGPARSATLVIDWGSGRRVVNLIDPEPAIRWHEAEDGWRATSLDLSEDLPVRYVPASEPLAVPRPTRTGDGAHLHVVEGTTAPHLLVAGPHQMRGLHVGVAPPIHRRFAASSRSGGLSTELDAWLGWSCAHTVHTLAAIEASRAAAAAERALLTTLCGPAWVTAEKRTTAARPFTRRLAEAAISLDLVQVDGLRSSGQQIDSQDIEELAFALAGSFAAHGDLFARMAARLTSEEEAQRLDEGVNSAWEHLTPSRQRRNLPPVDADTGNPAERWDRAWSMALTDRERSGLVAMILPPRLAGALRDLDYTAVEAVDVARIIEPLRLDRGSVARQRKRLFGTDILSALLLWIDPRAFSTLDWRTLALALLEDRMTARAVRYAALRMRDEREAI